MAKDKKGSSKSDAGAKQEAKLLRKLERDLAEAREAEEKRTREAADAVLEGASPEVLAKRQRKVEKALQREAEIQSEIDALTPAATAAAAEAPAPATAPKAKAAKPAAAKPAAAKPAPKAKGKAVAATAGDGPRAYCLREKITVTMAGPTPITMKNGRRATAGTCPSCGARLVRPG